MPRYQLRIYVDPGEAEIFCKIMRQDGTYERLTAVIDTGAAVSLFPDDLLPLVNFRPSDSATVVIAQAGIAQQSFQAEEGYITITLEDETGQVSRPIEILAWFAKTKHVLLGFVGLLDHSVLHIDMPQRTGWLEIEV